MPTYDYQCRDCGTTIEVVHSMLDDGPSRCEVCGGAMRRMVHPTGIIFRGSGFYKTDSRSSSSASVSSSKSGAKSGPDAAGSGPSDGAGTPAKTEPKKPEPAGGSTTSGD